MHRRTLLLSTLSAAGTGALLATAPLAGRAQTTAPFDAVAEIKKLRINTGAYAGAYQVAPAGALNWYFVNLGLIPIVQYLSTSDLDLHIRTYLDAYLTHLEKDRTIRDVTFAGGNPLGTAQKELSDSDDSYAATLLSLAMRYMQASQNWNWWNLRKAQLKDMAHRNLVASVKTNGLTSVFQAPRRAGNSLGYLMDNCEVYRGLRDFATVLRQSGETQAAAYHDSFANGIANAIATHLFDTARSGFLASDGDTRAGTAFYPGTTCQVFPEVFGINELSSYFGKAFAYLNAHSPNWQDGHWDAYPWAVLGCAAARHGSAGQAQARTQLQTVQQRFATQRGLVTINELGFFQRTRSLLEGRADV